MERILFIHQIEHRLTTSPAVALLGPRQCGKTTLARMVAQHRPGDVTHFDLEDPTGLAALSMPRLALQDLRGLDKLSIVYPGERSFPLTEKIQAVGLNTLLTENGA